METLLWKTVPDSGLPRASGLIDPALATQLSPQDDPSLMFLAGSSLGNLMPFFPSSFTIELCLGDISNHVLRKGE